PHCAPRSSPTRRSSDLAEEPARAKPLWEVGVAGGAGWLPDYPAAGQNHFNGIALPYLVYRGEFLRADEKGLVRGRFVKSRDFERSEEHTSELQSRENLV